MQWLSAMGAAMQHDKEIMFYLVDRLSFLQIYLPCFNAFLEAACPFVSK